LYDVAIVGAGINGCAMAYELTRLGKKVLLLDTEGIAAGGSGAAGAFISPKFSKAGELKELLHEAYLYSAEFYRNNFSHVFTQAPLIHIAKDEADDGMLQSYKAQTSLCLIETPPCYSALEETAKQRESVCLDGGIVDAKAACVALAKESMFYKHKVKKIHYKDENWVIDESYCAKDLILATGAYESLLQEPYIKLRGIWGHRIDVKTTTQNSCSLHQYVSISPTQEGVVAIGATHNVHYHPQKNTEPYNIQKGREELLYKASQTLQLENVEVIKDYTGLRSGSFDYIPILGRVVDSKETLRCCEKKVKVKRPDYKDFHYYPNLYMINGNGGYGFVLAPYLAKILAEHIVAQKEIPSSLQLARFFARWAKREN